MHVRHGSDVEIRPDRFFEGAWDGPFEAFAFERAEHLVGSGGVVRGDSVVFATPFHPLDWLYVLRSPDQVRISNSLVFVLEDARDGLDISYPNYFFDLLKAARKGTTVQPATLPTRNGSRAELYMACRLVVDPQLRVHREAMPLGPAPANYAEYFKLLSGTCQRIVDNAAAPARRATYRPVAACSRGYDSTAAAALAQLAGCTEGVTYTRSGYPTGHPLMGVSKPLSDDSGADSLRALGMEAYEFERMDVLKIPGHPKAEFFASLVAVTDASLRTMEDTLRGSIYFSGRHGERSWGPTARCRRQDYREEDDSHLSGRAATEFRLRTGYIHLPAPYIGGLHGPALNDITNSDEMRPWRLNTGYYDRPIARRIAEEAGVPRENFGHIKFGGGEAAWELGEESERDFREYVEAEVPAKILRRLRLGPISNRDQTHFKVKYLRSNYSHQPGASRLLELLQTDRLHRMWGSVYLYTFHWGYERIRHRYSA